jgi:hypothetical protein
VPGSIVPFEDPKKKMAKPQEGPDPMLNVEMGVERVLPFSYWGTEGEIARDGLVPLDELVRMRRTDGQARALIRLFTLPILSALADGEWIQPEEKGGEKETEFANQMWNLPEQAGGMSVSKSVVLKKTLQGLTDGFAVFEEVRSVPKDGPLKGKIVLESLAYRDPRTIRFRVDQKGKFNGIRQVASVGGFTTDVKIPKEKIWYWTNQAEENPYYGVSILEAAYFHYEIKRKLYYVAHLAAQFAAVPGRMGEIPKGADPRQVTAFKQMLMNFAFNTAATFPEGFKVTPFNGNSQFDFLKLIDHHNHMMSKSVLAAFVDSEQRATLIEVGRVDPNADFFVLALEAIMDDIAESWSSELMPKYIDWNFGTKVYPKFKFGVLSDAAKDTIKELFQTMVTSSTLNSTPEFVREMEKKLSKSLGLDIDYDEIEKQEQEAAEQQAKAQEAEAQQLGAVPAQPGAPGQPPAPGAPAAPPQGGGGQPQAIEPPGNPDGGVALTNVSIDDIIQAATDLFAERPDFSEEDEV